MRPHKLILLLTAAVLVSACSSGGGQSSSNGTFTLPPNNQQTAQVNPTCMLQYPTLTQKQIDLLCQYAPAGLCDSIIAENQQSLAQYDNCASSYQPPTSQSTCADSQSCLNQCAQTYQVKDLDGCSPATEQCITTIYNNEITDNLLNACAFAPTN